MNNIARATGFANGVPMATARARNMLAGSSAVAAASSSALTSLPRPVVTP
jgi:hypothetical protein